MIRSIENTIQHPHWVSWERCRPRSRLRRRSRNVEIIVFKKTRWRNQLVGLGLRIEMINRLCDRVGEDRQVVDQEQPGNSAHTCRHPIGVVKRPRLTIIVLEAVNFRISRFDVFAREAAEAIHSLHPFQHKRSSGLDHEGGSALVRTHSRKGASLRNSYFFFYLDSRTTAGRSRRVLFGSFGIFFQGPWGVSCKLTACAVSRRICFQDHE